MRSKENMQLMDGEEKPQITAEIDKCVYEWANETNGILIKSSKNSTYSASVSNITL